MPAVHDHLHSGTNGIGRPSGDSSTSWQETYTYDSGDRLTKACMDDACTRYYKYSYDGVGNRLSQKTELGTTRYTYDSADELTKEITPGPDVVYAYDLNGNETRDGSARYTYNLENEPTVLKKDGVKVASYAYTGDNLLNKKVTPSGSIFYGWDMNASLPRLALERDSQQGAVLRAYTYGVSPLELQTQQGTSTYHEDSLGSVVGLTDESGNEVASYRYSPYGQEWSSDGSTPSAEADANPLRFTGQYLDSDSDLYNMRAREYDPETGRFLEVDPLEAGTGEPDVGSYVYVDDRPTVMRDPSGEAAEESQSHHCSHKCGGIIVGNSLLRGVIHSPRNTAFYYEVRVTSSSDMLGWSGTIIIDKRKHNVVASFYKALWLKSPLHLTGWRKHTTHYEVGVYSSSNVITSAYVEIYAPYRCARPWY
jgi:RHS repeat-associated protein